MSEPASRDEDLIREIIAFRDGLQSLSIATLNESNEPESSYAPFVANDQNEVFVFVSGLAAHTWNLLNQGMAGLMFIEDESNATNTFARRRLIYQCRAEPVDKDTGDWNDIMSLFDQRFGRFMNTLRELPDFQLFRLVPYRGSYITGFGKAYTLAGEALSQVIPARPGVSAPEDDG
jgi:putative heme iron utilization protein